MTQSDETRLALTANVRGYRSRDERAYVQGAPHLKHRSIAAIYDSLVDDAVKSLPKPERHLSLLDLGTGSGLALQPWFRHGVEITAVDSSSAMIELMAARAREAGVTVHSTVDEATTFVGSCSRKFDAVTLVSVLHHIPDYVSLLTESAQLISPGGALITFQDPLRYDRLPPSHRAAATICYVWWRASQGNLVRGLRTRWRQMRGVFSPTEPSDFEEYHVMRKGVDSELIFALLQPLFENVRVVMYWSTQSSMGQRLGERLRLRASFAVLATGRL